MILSEINVIRTRGEANDFAAVRSGLEAQQRYFSYRVILVAIVSQYSFVFVFMGCRTIIVRYVAKRGIAQMCLCKTKGQGGGGIAPCGEVPTSLKRASRDMGYRSDSIAASLDMGPLRERAGPKLCTTTHVSAETEDPTVYGQNGVDLSVFPRFAC